MHPFNHLVRLVGRTLFFKKFFYQFAVHHCVSLLVSNRNNRALCNLYSIENFFIKGMFLQGDDEKTAPLNVARAKSTLFSGATGQVEYKKRRNTFTKENFY